jgi:hypothetical protein
MTAGSGSSTIIPARRDRVIELKDLWLATLASENINYKLVVESIIRHTFRRAIIIRSNPPIPGSCLNPDKRGRLVRSVTLRRKIQKSGSPIPLEYECVVGSKAASRDIVLFRMSEIVS